MQAFISHSSEDKTSALTLADGLRDRGVDVWVDAQILPGENLAESISEAVNSADIFVALFSARSRRSNWFASELATAIASRDRDQRKRIIPVTLSLDADLPAFVRSYRALDGSTPDKLQNVAREISQLLPHDDIKIPPNDFKELKEQIALVAATEAIETAKLEAALSRDDNQVRTNVLRSTMAASFVVAFVVLVGTGIALSMSGAVSTALFSALTSSLVGIFGALVGFYFGRSSGK